ncbi:MAG: hypothetical protein ABSH36_15740 [Solirubrobacteraceae bacterium]
MTDPAALIAEFLSLRDWLAAESKRMSEHYKPQRERMQEIQNILLHRANAESRDPHQPWSLRVDTGTAYRSTTMSAKVEDRDVWLDFALDGHEEGLQLAAPQVDFVKAWIEEHGGPPPGVGISFNTTVNIRKS